MKPNKIILICFIALMIGGIILAVKDIVKGHCGDSKCTYDVYTKEKIDELLVEANARLDNVYVKDNFAVLEGNYEGVVFAEPTNGALKMVDYPEGFTVNNTVIISKLLNNATSFGDYYNDGFDYRDGTIEQYFHVQLEPDRIRIEPMTSTPTVDWSDYSYKIVLLKYKD
jgi:hypothetical protein